MYKAFISEYIKNNQIIYTADLTEAIASKFNLSRKQASSASSKALSKMFKMNKLHRIFQGVYCKPGNLQPVSVLKKQILLNYLMKDCSGYYSGPTFFHEIGLCKTAPEAIYITCNRRHKKADENYIYTVLRKEKITRNNYIYFQMLDTIRDLDRYPVDILYPEIHISRVIEEKRIDKHLLIMFAYNYYSHAVLQRLLHILNIRYLKKD